MKPWKGSSGCSPDANFRTTTFAQTGISETGGSSSRSATGGRALCRDKACYGTLDPGVLDEPHGSCGEGIVPNHHYY